MLEVYQTYKVKYDQLHKQKIREQSPEHIDHKTAQRCYFPKERSQKRNNQSIMR